MGSNPSQSRQTTNNISNYQLGGFWICLFLVILTIAVFWQVFLCNFIAFDDDVYVLEEKTVTSGLNWRSISWAFTSHHAYMWHPLTSLSHIIDYQLFKDNPLGHHVVSLLIHAANVVILFLILNTMTGFRWQSAFVAAIFAIHPLQIESVAWVAERKNLMSGLFWLLTIAAYIRYAAKPMFSRYLLVIFVFCLALLSKPIVVTLPFALLLLDYWPLRRIGEYDNTELKTVRSHFPAVSIKQLILEKIPFFILAAVLSVITFKVQNSSGAVYTFDSYPLKIRISNALLSYTKYIEKLFYPTKLAFFYPYSKHKLTIINAATTAALLLVISTATLYMAKRRKYLPIGWLWFLGVLFPVIGLIQVGGQAMANRYVYLPSIGLLIIVAWGLPDLLSRFPNRKYILVSLSLSALLVLSIQTSLQLRYWHNSIDLFEYTLKVTEDNYAMHNNLCVLYNRSNNFDKSIMHGLKAVQIQPSLADLYYNLGIPLYRTGKIDKAIKCWETSIALDDENSKVHTNLGTLYYSRDNIDLAIKHFQRAIEIDRNDFLAHAQLGRIMSNKGQITQAFEHYRHSLKVNPKQPNTLYEYASLLERQNQLDEAIRQYRLALKLTPKNQQIRNALNTALQNRRNQTR